MVGNNILDILLFRGKGVVGNFEVSYVFLLRLSEATLWK